MVAIGGGECKTLFRAEFNGNVLTLQGKVRYIIVLVSLCLAALPGLAEQVCYNADESSARKNRFAGLLNSFRSAHGLSEVVQDDRLNEASREYACVMAARKHFDHVGPDGSQPWDRARAAGFSYCLIGENLGMGQADETSIMNGWINSRDHRSNMLQDGHTVFGFGAMQLAEKSTGLEELGLKNLATGKTREVARDENVPGNLGPIYWVLMLGAPGC